VRVGVVSKWAIPLELLCLSLLLFCAFVMYLRADVVRYSGVGVKDVENVALLSDEREADVPQGSGADKMDITEDIGGLLCPGIYARLFTNLGAIGSDEMMIDADPTTPPSVARDKSGLIPPSLAGGDAGTQSLGVCVANEGQPLGLNDRDSMFLVSDTLEGLRTIREGSADYELENAVGFSSFSLFLSLSISSNFDYLCILTRNLLIFSIRLVTNRCLALVML